jgi:hypothetical protein
MALYLLQVTTFNILSDSHVFRLLHGSSDGLGSLIVAAQHLIVPFLHLEVNLGDLILIILPQLPAVHLQRTLLHHTGHFLLAILELILFL